MFGGYETFGVHRGHQLLPRLVRAGENASEGLEIPLNNENYHLVGAGDTVIFQFKFGRVCDELEVSLLDLRLSPSLLANPLLQEEINATDNGVNDTAKTAELGDAAAAA